MTSFKKLKVKEIDISHIVTLKVTQQKIKFARKVEKIF